MPLALVVWVWLSQLCCVDTHKFQDVAWGPCTLQKLSAAPLICLCLCICLFVFVFSSPSGARDTSGWLSEFWLRLINADVDYDDFSSNGIFEGCHRRLRIWANTCNYTAQIRKYRNRATQREDLHLVGGRQDDEGRAGWRRRSKTPPSPWCRAGWRL